MMKNSMYAVERSDEYLAHYGIKGMKWGVRKALESGNNKALMRHYRKASRKLAKLEARAANGEKYRRRAIAAGAGAAGAAGLAIAGTKGVSAGLTALKEGGKNLGRHMENLSANIGNAAKAHPNKKWLGNIAGGVGAAGTAIRKASESNLGTAASAVDKWGQQSGKVTKAVKSAADAANTAVHNIRGAAGAGNIDAFQRAMDRSQAISKWNNDTIARAGAGLAGAGLAGVAGYNAYRAATTKRAAKKAAAFRSEMNNAFRGTGVQDTVRNSNKRRRRKG